MDNKTKKDIYSILSLLEYKDTEIDYYLKNTAKTLMIDINNPSVEDIQAILQGIILDYGKKRMGFDAEYDEEPVYILLAIKDIIPKFEYKNLSVGYYINGEKVDYNPFDINIDFEIKVKFNINNHVFDNIYDDEQYIEEFIQDINNEILIPMFKCRFYSLMNVDEGMKFVLLPSSVKPSEFIEFSDYL